MANVRITVEEADRAELGLLLSFRGLPRGKSERADGLFTVETSIAYRDQFEKFQEQFASHLSPLFELQD